MGHNFSMVWTRVSGKFDNVIDVGHYTLSNLLKMVLKWPRP